ncbi:glycosyl hydrolase family 28 protein [Arachidicoccus ginsenosidivorans]|uniref:glycosyl hydrolase family 28 protein n=1 Tax=Arachidicoccus ginsenosidivorans TaxID=496057 RepID=UPI0021D04D96|nr:glycosyl hydrolase family 28 protein [Arachidicoccus ginsenosidivorans]
MYCYKIWENPEGNRIGKPTRRVRITDCNFIKGHGISIGSEMSGGVSDVLVRDCQAGPLLHGLQIKGTKQRGGYVKNVRVLDCQLQQITIFSKLPYNNDGQAAPEIPTFSDYVFNNLDLSSSKQKGPAIDIHGFEDPNHKLRNVIFSDVLLPANATVSVNDAEDVIFTNVLTKDESKPTYTLKDSKNIRY